MLTRLGLALVVATMILVPASASADTITQEIPQSYIPPCPFHYGGNCNAFEQWNYSCPSGYSFGAWTDKYGDEYQLVSIQRDPDFVIFSTEYNPEYYTYATTPPLTYTCVSPAAGASATDLTALSVHRLVLTRTLKSRSTSMRLRCPKGERRLRSSTAIGFIHPTLIRSSVPSLVKSSHRRRTRSARMSVKVDRRLDKTHKVVAQLRIECAADPVR
jgi:hypothetical protein